ncbi:MAG: HypC/HybG/HupF family hydrogenase formation chaperone [Phycisphaerae bacterium]|nr:HypC/HybG/HupF family hydrogenase formation chaperone [Phycisphaerae bacterium]
MCLAVPGQIVSREGDELVVDFQGTRSPIGGVMTPEARCGDWVLVHAGYAISLLDEAEARKTWEYLRQAEQLLESEGVADVDHGD